MTKEIDKYKLVYCDHCFFDKSNIHTNIRKPKSINPMLSIAVKQKIRK